MPPDLLGNIPASSAWMLFWSAPRVIEIVHRTNAPVVPRAPIEAPSAAIRNPGLARATTKPSHHVIALRSCLSSTSAVAMNRSSLLGVSQRPAVVPIGTRPFYHASRTHVNMPQLIHRGEGRTERGGGPTRARPVVLATLSVRVDPTAERMAIDSALQAGVPLVLVNVIRLPPYATTIVMLGPEAATLPHEEDLDAVRETARRAAQLGVKTELLRVHTTRPVRALLEVVAERDAGLLVFGPHLGRVGRMRFRWAARRIRREASCLVWVAPDG